MMTREELYGGSINLEFPTNTSTIQLPDHFDIRGLYLFGNDFASGGVTLRLPDPQTIRQHGWLVFFIFNGVGIPVTPSTFRGTDPRARHSSR